ncbi:MAG: excisionase family DNA-binding protein [Patescibacteria group bacterium]
MENSPIRLSISQAARLFGISDRTLRRAISSNQIRYVVVKNRYQLNFESVLSWSQSKPKVLNKLEKQGIGQWVEKWKIKNPKFSPRPPQTN